MTTPNTPVSLPVWYMTIITASILIAVLYVGSGFLIPLAITALLYILSSALIDRIQQTNLWGWSPPSWLAQILGAGTIIGAIFLLSLIISSSAEEIQEALPKYQERTALLANEIEKFLGTRTLDSMRKAVAEADIGSFLSAAISQLGGAVSTFGLVALYLAFLMSERAAWMEKLPRLATTEAGTKRVRKIMTRISNGVKQYMWVNAVTSAMSGIVAYAIFSWIDLDFASLLALIVFVAGFIPSIGAFIGITLPSMVALIQFDSFTPFLIVLIGYGMSDQFIANVIQPSMQGKSLNLSTFMVMVSLTFWATIWGGIGAFLAVPMMVVMMVICAEIPATRWISVLLSSDGLLEDDRPDGEHTESAPRKSLFGKSSQATAKDPEVEQLRSELDSRDS